MRRLRKILAWRGVNLSKQRWGQFPVSTIGVRAVRALPRSFLSSQHGKIHPMKSIVISPVIFGTLPIRLVILGWKIRTKPVSEQFHLRQCCIPWSRFREKDLAASGKRRLQGLSGKRRLQRPPQPGNPTQLGLISQVPLGTISHPLSNPHIQSWRTAFVVNKLRSIKTLACGLLLIKS